MKKLYKEVLAKDMGARGVSPACNEKCGQNARVPGKACLPVCRQAGFARTSKVIFLLAIMSCFAGSCFAWDDEITGTTEITGYYQQYRNFSFETGRDSWNFDPTRLSGGGFSVSHNFAYWFAIWSQFSFYGTANQEGVLYDNEGYAYPKSVRIIHNLEGLRYQTRQYGPLQFYGKAGVGFVHYSLFDGALSGTKFSAGYGGGANVWLHKNIGITLDVSHNLLNLPNLTDLDGREKFDSGMTYTTGLTFRF